jgi:16S rRNA (guanine527-N7)-methyltransferase
LNETESTDEDHLSDLDLAGALAARNILLPADRIELLDRYRALLWSWNEQLNLTRHTTIAKFVDRDVVDSLQLVEFIRQRERVLDVGAGGGVPGLVIAICRPDLRVTVCDSTQKKARVLQAVIQDLGLPVEAFGCRAEELLEIRTFDTLVARAVAPLAKILYWLMPHWESMDQLLLIKGRNWVDERSEARHRGLLRDLELRKIASYGSASLPGESVVLRIRAKTEDS